MSKPKDEEIHSFLNKYTDNDDDYSEIDGKKMEIEKRKRPKANKQEIRTSNKLFSNLTYQEDIG